MTQPGYLDAYPWLRTSPVGLEKAHITRVQAQQLGDPENALLLQLFLNYLEANGGPYVSFYRETLNAMILDVPPRDWPTARYEEWTKSVGAIYREFQQQAVTLRSLCGGKSDVRVRQALSARMAAELATKEAGQGVDGWVDVLMTIGSQIDLKDQVNDAVNAFAPFERLGWKQAQATISGYIGAAIMAYSEQEDQLRMAARTYRNADEAKKDEARAAMTLVLITYSEAGEKLGRSIYDTAKEAVDWAKAEAKDRIKQNMATEHNDISNGLLAMSTCVYVISGALGAVGIAFPPAAVAGGVLAGLATAVKWLTTEIVAGKDVENRDKVKEMLTVQFAGGSGDGRELVERISQVTGGTEKGKAAVEGLAKLTSVISDQVGSTTGQAVAEGMTKVTDVVGKPMIAISPLTAAAELSLEFLAGDAKEKIPKYDSAETGRLLMCVDYAYNQLDPSTREVNRKDSTLHQALGGNRYEVTLVGANGVPVKGIIDGNTNSFGVDQTETFKRFSELVRADASSVTWWDDGLKVSISALVDLRPENCVIDRYNAAAGRVEVSRANVWYSATVVDQSEPAVRWQEERALRVYASGELDLTWAYAQIPYIPELARNPKLLDDGVIAEDGHPYRQYVEVKVTEMGRVVEKRYSPPEQEKETFDKWQRALQARYSQEDQEDNRRLGEALDRGGY